jgi:hypothetical protein
MSNIFIATPTTRAFEGEFVMSLYQTKNPDTCLWQPIYNLPIDEARNKLGLHFLKHDARFDFILFVDSDASWHMDAVMRLADRDLPVVTGGIYLRKLPPMPTIGQYVGRNPDGHHMYEYGSVIQHLLDYAERRGLGEDIDNALCLDKEDDVTDLLEVDGCGCHFMMVRRDVLEKIRLPWFRGSNGGGEDYYFSRKVKDAGFPIYFDLTVHTGHIAGQGADFGLRELLSYYKYIKPEDVYAQKERVMDVG